MFVMPLQSITFSFASHPNDIITINDAQCIIEIIRYLQINEKVLKNLTVKLVVDNHKYDDDVISLFMD